ncbi:MAG: AAA family ATPase [Bacteroidetes bacterium]|nr:AAA family ATPase [Bacteroidota bacterium]
MKIDPFVINALKYWKNTLADSARAEINFDKSVYLKKCDVDFEGGKIDVRNALELIGNEESRVNKIQGIESKDNANWQTIDEVQVLIAPFYVSPVPEYLQITGEEGPFYPFWIKAILNKQGILRPDEDTFPYIPRVYLEPQVNEKFNFVFSHVDTVDKAFAKNFSEESWPEFWHYVQSVFSEITDSTIEDFSSVGFHTIKERAIVVNNSFRNPADGIIQLYDFFLKQDQLPNLLQNLCRKDFESLKGLISVEDFEKDSLLHLGQMGFEYPLSPSQRKSLYHFNRQEHGTVLAVNGPPGTGKTTLLQSIVANEVVTSAIEGEAPRIIVACSTNNQAVTNIIDSFYNVKTKSGHLYERWIPDISSFALYLPSRKKNVAPKYHYYKGLDDGIRTKIETPDFLDEAKKFYSEKFKAHSGESNSVRETVNYLRDELLRRKDRLVKGVDLWKRFKEVRSFDKQLTASESILSNGEVNQAVLDRIETNLIDLENKFSNYLDTESLWMKLFSFFNFIKEKRAVRLKQIFRESIVDYKSVDFYKTSSLTLFFDEKISLVKKIREVSAAWVNWKNENSVAGNPPFDAADFKNKQLFFYDELEVGIKNEMFHLAAHYWEGRWILDMEKVIEKDKLRKMGAKDSLWRFQRLAMLTPCFVSTFYMAPKYFSYSKFIKEVDSKKIYEQPPLLDGIDLLIVDEAGQVSPEVGAATFGLAKRAIVVGDTKQIEPVWSVPKKIDHANLFRFDLANADDEETIVDLDAKGFFGSSGSIMMLAQKSSAYQLNDKIDRGMLLTEHRRCFDEIIDYCNKLAYGGLLEPKKGKARNVLFEPMKFIPVDGESQSSNSSRVNRTEAQEIAQWIRNNSNKIISHYQNRETDEARKENRPPKKINLADVIGIITPFTSQKAAIKMALKEFGVDTNGLTIGTVHALQGAERQIILFSSVYGRNPNGRNHTGGYFFDMGVNMLNVAVSRAKDNFIMFGCPDLFENKNGTPSSILFKHINCSSFDLI